MAALSTTARGDARRDEILDAARRCFLRDGFHATSMQDLLKASGLSAGAFYRYFPGKQAIVLALCEAAIADMAATVDADRAPPSLAAVLGRVVEKLAEMEAEKGGLRLAILVWSEAQRDPDLRRAIVGALTPLATFFEAAVCAEQSRGRLRADVAARDLARAIVGIVQGFMVQHVLMGTSAADYEAGITGLFAPPR